MAQPAADILVLSKLAALTGCAAPHQGWLVRKGRLVATERGGRWYSMVTAAECYRVDVEQGWVLRDRPRKK